MGICKDLYDRLPDTRFVIDLDKFHGKYPITITNDIRSNGTRTQKAANRKGSRLQ